MFVVLVGFIVDLVPLALESRAASYVRITLRQPETEQRLHLRVLKVYLLDLALQVEHKGNVHACYRVWFGQVPTRAKQLKRVVQGVNSVGACGCGLGAGGSDNGYTGDGDVAYRKYTTHTCHRSWVRAQAGLPRGRCSCFCVN